MKTTIFVFALAVAVASGRVLEPQTPLRADSSEESVRPRPSRFATTITRSPDYQPLVCVAGPHQLRQHSFVVVTEQSAVICLHRLLANTALPLTTPLQEEPAARHPPVI